MEKIEINSLNKSISYKWEDFLITILVDIDSTPICWMINWICYNNIILEQIENWLWISLIDYISEWFDFNDNLPLNIETDYMLKVFENIIKTLFYDKKYKAFNNGGG